jgi:hypothetical protein
VDETSFSYAAILEKGLARQGQSGCKQSKTCLTRTFTVNASGTESRDPLFIGTAAKPHAFKVKTAQELGFDYYSKKNAWIQNVLKHGITGSLQNRNMLFFSLTTSLVTKLTLSQQTFRLSSSHQITYHLCSLAMLE